MNLASHGVSEFLLRDEFSGLFPMDSASGKRTSLAVRDLERLLGLATTRILCRHLASFSPTEIAISVC